MDKPSLRERFSYWFDNIMGRGTAALLGFLGLMVALIVLLDALFIMVIDGTRHENEGGNLIEVLWDNAIRLLGADDVSPGSTWVYRIAALLITVVGVFFAANLVGIISGAFNARLAMLRQGKSRVLESGHTVILGWNSKIMAVIEGLVAANASSKNALIVILADRDRAEMDDEIRAKLGSTGRTRVIARRGDLLDQDDLLRAAPFKAKSVIVLSPDDGTDQDARSIKTVLALTQHPKRAGRPINIVGHIRSSKNLDAAKLAGGDDAVWLLSSQKVGQITAQTSRQPGLSNVYLELLSFGGVETYLTHQQALAGMTFADAQFAFSRTCLLGVAPAPGGVDLNPDGGRVIAADDKLIVLSEDDSTIFPEQPGTPVRSLLSGRTEAAVGPERTLIIGANSCLPHVLGEISKYSAPGSQVTICSEFPVAEVGVHPNLEVTEVEGDATARGVLESLDPLSYDHAVVVSYRDNLPVQEADMKTLVTLLHLRDMIAQSDNDLNIVSEIIDERNRRLAEVTRIDDFIVSDRLVSLMMTQISENAQLVDVFGELFSAEGAEIYLRPATWYVDEGAEADFYTVIAGARARNETAMGYLAAAVTDHAQPTIVLAPDKAAKRVYGPGDRVVVLANE